jgi:nitrite reductase/ring-hydroxylating ferredoxin subunit
MMERTKKYRWHKIATDIAEINFSENRLTALTVGDKKICIALHNQQLLACVQKCPHAGGHLSDGYIDGTGSIVCPLHRYKFNLQNGRNTSGEGYFLKTYPVEIRAEGVFIGFEENNGLNWLK